MSFPASAPDGVVEIEGQPLLRDDQQERGTRSWRTKALGALVTVGLCGTAYYALAPSSAKHPAKVAPSDAFQELADYPQWSTANYPRKRLIVERDLGNMIHDGMLPPRAQLQSEGGLSTVPEAAEVIFDYFVETSGIASELTAKELEKFRARFLAGIVQQTWADKWWNGDIVEEAKKHLERQKPIMTKALEKAVNEAQDGYKVKMEPWMEDMSNLEFQKRLGRLPFPDDDEELKKRTFAKRLGLKATGGGPLPAEFDARTKWPECADVIGRIHNQGSCGSCWVFGAMGPLDSRMCIASNGDFSGDVATMSRGFGASCVSEGQGCQGGWEYFVYKYLDQPDVRGIPTTRCVPYFAGGDYASHWTNTEPAPVCPTECDGRYNRELIMEDTFKPSGIGNFQLVTGPFPDGIEDMKRSIFETGPVAFGIFAVGEFMAYTSGVYSACADSANHAVHAIGFGADYILGQNSWGEDWGDAGRFKIGHCGVTDFTVPGPIERKSVKEWPMPLSDEVRTTKSTTPPPVPTTLPCVTHEDGCVTSPNYPQPYGPNQKCDISYKLGKIKVVEFETEANYDVLTVNYRGYSGTAGPAGVVPTANIHWTSDGTGQAKGWKICPDAGDEPAPEPSP